MSFIRDGRYDPCRTHSKLGVSIDQVVEAVTRSRGRLAGVTGAHFHTNCDSVSLRPLLATLRHSEAHLASFFGQLEWMNLGGGYLFNKATDLEGFFEAVDLLRTKYDLDVFIEPGADLVRDSGYLIASVLDLFTSDGKTIAVLDTTVNHMPEVFEYQFTPDVAGHVENGCYKYILAGCTCLAGDIFGEYAFDEPLEIGSRVVFLEAGAYTLVKAHMFNGVNLPTIYSLNEMGQLVLRKAFTYSDFASRCGVDSRVAV
jgi:carboxynorspermidine decarboxylase